MSGGRWRFGPWGYRLGFALAAVALFFVQLLPLAREAGSLPGPDLLLCLTFIWVQRQPKAVPVWLIALVFFLADLLFLRPPGLWTALVIMGSEFLRARAPLSHELNLVMKWLLVACVLLAMFIASRVLMALTLTPLTPLGFEAVGLLWTIAAYPVVAGLSQLAFKLQKPAPGQLAPTGRRM